ncbi:MAG: serine/threonine-protein kinase, partial [Thermoanaerobaculia bacterium]
METLGTYRLISRLGAGGMGEVWRAEDTRLLRPVAIKILNDKISGDPEWTARFLREARTIAQMNHPNIATIYAIEQDGDRLFIAMELIDGDPLTVMFAKGPVEPREAVRIFRQVAEALGEAHEKGVVHRDVKPDNIIMAKRLVKVLDFGIAKQMAGNSKESALTQGGMIIGTPFYMSPEQAL